MRTACEFIRDVSVRSVTRKLGGRRSLTTWKISEVALGKAFHRLIYSDSGRLPKRTTSTVSGCRRFQFAKT